MFCQIVGSTKLKIKYYTTLLDTMTIIEEF